MTWPWTQALLCLGVKGHLSPFLSSPCVQHWACQGGLQGSQMNGFIQQYKLSTYCVSGHRKDPALMALSLVWEEDAQIKVQLQGRQMLSRVGGVVFCGKLLRRGEGWTKKRELKSSQEHRMMCKGPVVGRGGRGQRGKYGGWPLGTGLPLGTGWQGTECWR